MPSIRTIGWTSTHCPAYWRTHRSASKCFPNRPAAVNTWYWMDEQFAHQHVPLVNHRVQSAGNGRALALARDLRRLLLAPQPDRLALEQGVLAFVALAGVPAETAQRTTAQAFARVLDQIAEQFHQPLSLEQLAVTYGHNEL